MLEDLYTLLEWPSDPLSPSGKRRMFEAMEILDRVLEHDYMKKVLENRNRVRILDVCSGGGVAGFALAKLLMSRGYEVRLTLVDLRAHELEKAHAYRDNYMKELVLETYAIDAKRVHELGKKFDIALMWGLSLPHFSPWDAIKLFISVAKSLEKNSVFLLDECDRMSTIFMKMGYKLIVPAGFSEKPIVDIHRGYDIARGMIKRVVVDLSTGKYVNHELCLLWSLSTIASLLWVVFSDVDVVMYGRATDRFVVIAYSPRDSVSLDDLLLKEPSLLRRELVI